MHLIIAVVVTFEGNTCYVTLSDVTTEEQLKALVGKPVTYQGAIGEASKGTIVGLDGDFLVVNFQEGAAIPGQGSQVRIHDEG
jgi:ribosomal protein L35AE/L33A